jgi:hypothetical protein
LATQTQLKSVEDKLEDARIKVSIAEVKWVARLRELEARLKANEEKVKRERQGAKERVVELAETIRFVLTFLISLQLKLILLPLDAINRSLESQVAGAGRRNQQMEGVIHTATR